MPARTTPTATTPTTCATPWPTSRAAICCPTSGWTSSPSCRPATNRRNGSTDGVRRGYRDRGTRGPAAAAGARGRGDGDPEDRPVQSREPGRRRVAELPGAVPAQRPAAQPADLCQELPRRDADLPAVLRARGVRVGCDADQRGQPVGLQGADARPAAEKAW